MSVFVLPPSESWRSLVNLESLGNVLALAIHQSTDDITQEHSRDKLILQPSFNRSPEAPVFDCRSEPAKIHQIQLTHRKMIFAALVFSIHFQDYCEDTMNEKTLHSSK